MGEPGRHCPFLNRADERCSEHFRLDHLGEAFGQCFDRYHACPTYQELLLERQCRRAEAAALLAAHGGEKAAPTGAWGWEEAGTRHGRQAAEADGSEAGRADGPGAGRFVQVTVAHRHPKPPAAGAGVPPPPGV